MKGKRTMRLDMEPFLAYDYKMRLRRMSEDLRKEVLSNNLFKKEEKQDATLPAVQADAQSQQRSFERSELLSRIEVSAVDVT
jgi:hypothetical protein